MKITKALRIFLILLSVMMVLPLFACGDTPEETTTKSPEESTVAKTENSATDIQVETTVETDSSTFDDTISSNTENTDSEETVESVIETTEVSTVEETESSTFSNTDESTVEKTEDPTSQDTEESTVEETDNSAEDTTEAATLTETESFTDEETVSEEKSESESLTGEHAELIENADSLKNKVTAYYTDGNRDQVVFENMDMVLDYNLSSGSSQLVSSLSNKAGASYVLDTMDVFVRMTDGNTYFASGSTANAFFNIHRLGYYFYQMRVEGQDFIGGLEVKSEIDVNIDNPTSKAYIDAYKYRKTDGYAEVKNADLAKDPRIVYGELEIPADKYTVLELTIKADEKCSANTDLFFVAGSYTGINSTQRLRVQLITDGEWHTYRIPMYTGSDYTGTLTKIALDINGSGARYYIKDVKFLEIDMENVPSDLSLCRTFNVYSDKMHHVVQVATTAETSGIKEIGMQTVIEADKVAKLVAMDANGLHYSIDEVDWSSAEYVGFDIIDAGIFGYILPFDGKGGSIKVELVDDKYVIEQVMAPANGTIKPSRTTYDTVNQRYNWVPGGNTNDLFMGQRIYTDDTHDFSKFLEEAYCERNPLPENSFRIFTNSSTTASYGGYDSLRGIYKINIGGVTGFNTPYYSTPNRHYRANFSVSGDEHDRKIYAMTYYTSGQLECAVLLDENDVLIPVPLEVGKNFSETYGERNLYNLADAMYSETIFPLVVTADERYQYTVINLYQNWGNYPLKQISWIQFFSPYYHLSTGVTETNCILPWTFTNQIWYNTLPDFRGMSAPHWDDEPQHTSAGDHDWLRYVDSEGNVIRAENTYNTIDSYGPTYADVKMDYVTYDGKMKISYTHTEMPQTDENRTYYEIKYEVLGDITINDVVNNLQLYKVNPNDSVGKYKRVGYLNSDNESVVVDANETETPVKYTLGNECPYFSFFDMDNHSNEKGYGNLAFLLYNSEFIISGEKAEPSFAIVNHTDCVYLTLDLESLTLKAGDSITINCILLPWGSQQLDDGIIDAENGNLEYTMELADGSLYMDKNVRDVRENTLLNPLKAVAGENSEIIESVFLPKVRATDGESAEFTLKGGYNNVAVRVYGFKKMTVPTIYEKIDGEWQKYDVSSQHDEKYPHKYDGYLVHYDGDGTFSYSFVTDMDGENDRTFKIVADGNYESWRKETVEQVEERKDLLNIYADPVELAALISSKRVSKSEVLEEESFVRFYGAGPDAEYAEAYVTAYKVGAIPKESGKYVAFKYRIPAENTETIARFDIFVSTTATVAGNDNVVYFKNVKNDGEWYTVIIDLEHVATEAFKTGFAADSEGKYYPNFLRFDFFDRKMSKESYIDIAFVGMDDSLADIAALSQDCKNITLIEGENSFEVDANTGEKIDLTVKVPDVLVDPSSGYTKAELEYGAQMDYINGVLVSTTGGSKKGTAGIMHNASTIADRSVTDCATVEGYNLVFGGWCVVEGGVDHYVWSADGGVTWHETVDFGKSTSSASTNNITVANARSNQTYEFTLEADGANGSFSGTAGNNPKGIAANLEAYKGQTVDVIFAAVPAKDTGTILPIFYIAKVKVAE